MVRMRAGFIGLLLICGPIGCGGDDDDASGGNAGASAEAGVGGRTSGASGSSGESGSGGSGGASGRAGSSGASGSSGESGSGGSGGGSGSGGSGGASGRGGSGGGSGSGGTGGASGRGGAGGASGSAGSSGSSGLGGSGGSAGSGGASGASGASGSGGSTLGCTLAWSSGFETGFPGDEWLDYDNGAWSADGSMPDGRVSAWTIIDRDSGEPVFSGEHAYKGWIEAADSDSHRAYPVLHTDIATPLVNTFMVYLDLDYDVLGDEWVHFGTWGNEEDGVGTWALHTMSVRFRELEFAHTNPSSGEYIGPEPQPEFPLGRWVRFTVYIHYEGTTGFVQAWQDGVPMLRAEVSQLADSPGTRLTRAHWGMYAGSTASQGVQYNDDIRIWTLDEPLSDLDTEPDCYL